MKNRAYSLPEALITLIIVGVVSALLIPTVVREFNERVNSYKEASIANKITQAMEHMYASGDLNYYNTTEEFVNSLKDHLKIIKVCDNQHLTDCWPTKVVRNSKGESYEVKNAINGKSLYTGYLTNTVGIVLADGSQIIMSYDPEVGTSAGDDVTGIKKTLPIGFGKTKEFAYTTSITKGIDFVMDVNGTAGPNAETDENGEYNDIRSFRYASFSKLCSGVKYGDLCVVDLGTNYTSLSCLDEEKNTQYCTPYTENVSTRQMSDYMAGGRKACAKLGLDLPDLGTLQNLVGKDKMPQEGKYISKSLAFSNRAYYVQNFANKSNSEIYERNQQFKALCVGD